MQGKGSVAGQVYELKPMCLKVLGSPNYAVDIIVVSVTGVFIIDLEVAHSGTVGADSPWKKSKELQWAYK